jgi:hypothetical protein
MSVYFIEVSMSLLDEPARRHSGRDHQAKRIKRRKKTEAERVAMREADRAVIAKAQNANQVLTFRQWTLLAGVSVDTARRLIKAGNGPIITQMSQRRIGVRLADHIRWQATRARGAV